MKRRNRNCGLRFTRVAPGCIQCVLRLIQSRTAGNSCVSFIKEQCSALFPCHARLMKFVRIFHATKAIIGKQSFNVKVVQLLYQLFSTCVDVTVRYKPSRALSYCLSVSNLEYAPNAHVIITSTPFTFYNFSHHCTRLEFSPTRITRPQLGPYSGQPADRAQGH